jgi:hypothetical protein
MRLNKERATGLATDLQVGAEVVCRAERSGVRR